MNKQSIIRTIVAFSQNKILNKLFENISEDRFDLNVDLDDFSNENLNDFWLYSTGFLSVQNFENIIDEMTDEEVDNISDGNFLLRRLTNEEATALVESAGKKIPRSGVSHIIDLYTIQDGTYYVKKSISRPFSSKEYKPSSLGLRTKEVEYFYYFDEDAGITNRQILKIIRNLLVHTAPYVNGSKLALLGKREQIYFTKMWLRGYAELFSLKQVKIDAQKIEEHLKQNLNENTISNSQDLDKALSMIKEFFPEDVVKQFFRVNNFVKLRTAYYDNFYAKDIDEKIKIIASICSNNPKYISGSNGGLEPSIIYNIQQVVARELSNRGVKASLSDEDIESLKYRQLEDEYKDFIEQTKQLQKLSYNSSFAQTKYKRLNQQLKSIENRFNAQEKLLINRLKLESSHAELHGLYGLENLPVEVAVNLVCLMGYNNLVTSAFYEDLLDNQESELDNKQKAFFDQFDFSKINVKFYDKKMPKDYTAEEKKYLLTCLRDAICHNQISYTLPPAKKDSNLNFKDVELCFTADWLRTSISGKVIDFFNLFNSKAFTQRYMAMLEQLRNEAHQNNNIEPLEVEDISDDLELTDEDEEFSDELSEQSQENSSNKPNQTDESSQNTNHQPGSN